MSRGKWFASMACIGISLSASVRLQGQELSFIESNGKNDFRYVGVDLENRRLHTYGEDFEQSDIARTFRVCGTETPYICFVESELQIVFAIPRDLGERSQWKFGGNEYTIEDRFVKDGQPFYLIGSSQDSSPSGEVAGATSQAEVTWRSSALYSEMAGLISYMKFRVQGETESLSLAAQFGEGLGFEVLETSGEGKELFSESEVETLSGEKFQFNGLLPFLISRESSDFPAAAP